MTVRVFITGISGYVGGQIVTDLSTEHPAFQLVGLVRTDKHAKKVREKLPAIQTVKGDLSSHKILVQEAQKADIVIQAADCDNVAAVKSLITGLSQGGKGGSFIQVSGAASIVDASNGYGQLSSRIYDDVKDVSEITSFDSSHWHWDADQAVIREGKELGVKTAIVIPPTVYGKGEGPIKTTSMQIPWLKKSILERGKGFTIGEGKNSWAEIHVKDLVAAIILLLENALQPDGGKATWGSEGFYYVEAGSYVFAEILPEVVKILKSKMLIEGLEIDQLAEDEATSLNPYALMIWGTNVKCQASRLRSLGWKAAQPSLYEMLPSLLA